MKPSSRSVSIDNQSIQSETLRSLQKKLSLKFTSEYEEAPPYSLFERNNSLGVFSRDKKTEFLLDFCTEDFCNRLFSKLSRKDPLIRAVGKDTKSVFDMTMGFAQDAILLAAYGKEVWACEENPIIFSMVQQALKGLHSDAQYFSTHGVKGKELLSKISNFLHIYGSNSLSHLQQREDLSFDVIYLDPMFSLSSKGGRKAKDIEFLKLLAVSGNREELFLKACSHAKRRVVVKQALKESLEYPRKTSFQVKGKSHRFDVFLM